MGSAGRLPAWKAILVILGILLVVGLLIYPFMSWWVEQRELECGQTCSKMGFSGYWSCLYLPISLTTFVVVWRAFHLLTTVPWRLSRFENLPTWLPDFPWLSSLFAYDVLRFLLYVGTVFTIFLRTGEHLERIADLQESANSGVQATPASGHALTPDVERT